MGKASRAKKERRQLRVTREEQKALEQISFSYNFEKSKGTGCLVPAEQDEVFNNPDKYAAAFVPAADWPSFVSVLGEEDFSDFEPAPVTHVVRGQVGRIGNCLLFTDACIPQDRRTLDHICAVKL